MPDYKTETLAFSKPSVTFESNRPPQYDGSIQRQYMANRNKAMLKMSKIACDYVGADIQGLQEDDFFAYTPKKIRLADAKSLSTISPKKTDDYKEMLVDDPNVDYVPMGAKVVTMGSTFLVTNPYNLSGALPKTLLTRCNTSYNHFDEYGNVIYEPVAVGKELMLGSENEHLKNLMMMNGYYNIVCQLNKYTESLDINQRICLGHKIYHICGFDDFIQEFTGDRSSVRLLSFVAYIEEPTQFDDVTEKFVANASNFSFAMDTDLGNKMYVGIMRLVTPRFYINGTESEAPVTWGISSDNPSVIEVYPFGQNVRLDPKSSGTAHVTIWLEQNPDIRTTYEINALISGGWSLDLESIFPTEIKQYTSGSLTAILYSSGIPVDPAKYEFEFAFGGAPERSYTAVASGNSVTITCLEPSDTPLSVKVSAYGKNQTLLAETPTQYINLIGY